MDIQAISTRETRPEAPAQSPGIATRPDPKMWENVPELDCAVTDIEGKLPEGLVGELLRNGPGKRDLGHYFWDGDGMVRALRFSPGGKVHYRSRYIHTTKYLAEKDAKEPVYRTAGTNRPGGILANAFRMPTTEANTHLLWHAGKLLALHEGGHPYALDRASLATHGAEHFGGELPRTCTFSAHPHLDPETGEVFNCGFITGATGTKIRGFKITPQGRLQRIADASISGMSMIHDFALTQRWLVFFVPPVRLSMARMLLGVGPVFSAFRWQEGQAGQVILMSRDGREQLRFDTEPLLFGHTIVARDEGDEVVVDFVRAPSWASVEKGLSEYRTTGLPFTEELCLWRMRLNTRTRRHHSEELCPLPGDFPRGNEKLASHAQRYSYLAMNPAPRMQGLFRATVKIDTHTGKYDVFDFGDGFATQEPIFVPNPEGNAEDDGWLLQFVHNNQRHATDTVIFHAQRISEGPICTVRLPANAGMTFHGIWIG